MIRFALLWLLGTVCLNSLVYAQPFYSCTSSTKSGQMRVKREERVLPTLDPLKNMTFPAFKH